MADPVLSISAASGIGRNFATLNGTITPNGTTRTWWTGRDPEDGVTDLTESRSDTEYFWEFVSRSAGTSPFLTAVSLEWGNTTDYPPVTKPVEATGATPITLADIAYMLGTDTTYTVRLCARRYLFPGTGSGDRYRRENQPYELFFTAPIDFTLLVI
jgi:hypothetical protein